MRWWMVTYLTIAMLSAPASRDSTQQDTWTFEAQTGFFSHDQDPSDWSFRATTRPQLGLLKRDYPTDESLTWSQSDSPWVRFRHYVEQVNLQASPHTRYKVLYLARHGEGIHNVAERQIGKEAWDTTWSRLDGDGKGLIWRDAELTEKGRQDALNANAFWRTSTAEDKVVFPQSIYSSPLRRCLMTAEMTFRDIARSQDKRYRPVIKEFLRERLHDQTCNARSSKTWIKEHFPAFEMDKTFTEEDELWTTNPIETNGEHDRRTKALLEDIFENDDAEFIALSMHALSTRSMFRVTGYHEVAIAAGATFPLFVKGTRAA